MPTIVAPDEAGIARGARALREGALVVFPTETVYGLGAHALDEAAVRAVFAAKGRPPENPLIVHVADVAAARALVAAWGEDAERLARAFWPGPLTLVLPRDPRVPDVTTGGLGSVAVRVPDHPVAQALLRASGVPVAAPSANRSGRPSPTRVADAVADLGDAVAVYLDGGATRVGVESTVVSLLGEAPLMLRPGGVSLEALAEVAPRVVAHAAADDARHSPGMRHRHYAPRARLFLVEGGADALLAEARERARGGARVAVVASREGAPSWPDVRVPGGRTEGDAWAARIFALLRDLDAEGYDAVVVESIPPTGLGRAVMDRLRRAANAQR